MLCNIHVRLIESSWLVFLRELVQMNPTTFTSRVTDQFQDGGEKRASCCDLHSLAGRDPQTQSRLLNQHQAS